MNSQEIYNKLKAKFGDNVLELVQEAATDPFIVVKAEKIFDIGLFLRNEKDTAFNYLMCLSALDLKDKLQVVYHLYSMLHTHKIVLKLTVPKDEPSVPTVERVWRSADWHEREAWDLLGVKFVGHHNHIRILCPYDWEGHPLRKDYVAPEYFHNMKVPY